jgi:hypothetical protein
MTSKEFLRSVVILLFAACIFWVARFARMFAPDFFEVAPTIGWLIAFFGYIASIAGLNLVARFESTGGGTSPRSHTLARFWLILAFSGLVFLPFAPDVFAAFLEGLNDRSRSMRVVLAFGLTVFAWSCVTLVGALYRLPLIWMRDRRRIRFGYLALLPFLETTQLAFFPFAYIGSMALPVSFSPLQQSFRENPSSQLGQPKLLSVAYAANWSDETRSRLRREPEDSRIFETIRADLESVVVYESESILRVYFPETLFDVPSVRLVSLYEAVEEAMKLRLPWLKHIEFFAGVGSSASNSVVWVGRNELTGMVQLRSATRKAIPVPFFEIPIFGLRFWESVDASSASESDWGDLLPLRDRDRPTSDVPLPQFLICYEGLFPQLRDYGVDAVVFTNHNLFSRYTLLSRSYDEMLLLISSGARQRVLLVGNSGQTGVAQLWRDSSGSSALGRVHVVVGSNPGTDETD